MRSCPASQATVPENRLLQHDELRVSDNKMNVQSYTEALEQRLQLRRDLRQRLQAIREVAGALGAAAGGLKPLSAGPLPEQDPLTQIDPLCAAAGSLTQMLRRNQAEVTGVEQALRAAHRRARRLALLRNGLIVLGVLGLLAALWLGRG